MKNKRYKIVTILGLNCGLLTHNYIASLPNIDLVGVYSKKPQESKNIAGYINMQDNISHKYFNFYSNIKQLEKKIENLDRIDLIIAVGISDILTPLIINKSHQGVIGAHAAKLPQRPGCSPIIWSILDNMKTTEMTIFKMSNKVDDGLIYDSKKIAIKSGETGGTLRLKMDNALIDLLKKNFMKIVSGKKKGKKLFGKRNYTRKRGARDGQLDLNENSDSIIRKIRALHKPYPGAHIYSGDGKPIIIEQAKLGDSSLIYKGSGSNFKDQVLCIVAHPDDEALGLGGTLIKHSEQGDEVNIIILSEGEDAKFIKKNKDPNRKLHAEEWCKKTNCNLYALYDFPDQKLDSVPQIKIVKLIEKAIIELRPTIVYIHHPGDMNSDHQIAAQTSLAAIRPMSHHGIKPEIRSFETPSSTDQSPMVEPYLFKPNYYVSVENQWEKKIDALKVYAKELGKTPHPRSLSAIKALARKRGSESGFYLSEAFYILRKVWA